ncbi:hypothetical protein [Pseudomonas sp. 2023EL-01195]|uniref:hypothetical protein n=1 Tax=Pseudomonas sp. 2023EL-01195 TaxID=3088134 RepID=UPI00296B192B|nr:hypothetical protein [Pseudomonas sp. 2023EL-01195]MDW3716586.1 hypothetical protein [Pseudomonas sp. 2023EL-01195]
MCDGVEAREADRTWKIDFTSQDAAIPVLFEEGGQVEWISWGRREDQLGNGPAGGWADLAAIRAGGWAQYQPRRAFGLVRRFRKEEDHMGEENRSSYWFDIPQGQALECLVIGEGEERRVYVVTTAPPEEYTCIHDRWPVLAEY